MTTSLVNVTTYGAAADNGTTDNTGPFQTALDAAKAIPGSAVYIPGGQQAYYCNAPVWIDGNTTRIYGDGLATRITSGNGPPFIVGIARAPVGGTHANLPATAIPEVDNTGGSPKILDSSVGGTIYGYRTTSTEGLSFFGSPALLGPVDARLVTGGVSSSFSAFTIDFIAQCNSNWVAANDYALMGAIINDYVSGWVPAPYYLYVPASDHKIHLQLRTADGVTRDFTLTSALASGTGTHRVSVEVDLAGGAVHCYLDGTTQTVSGTLPASSVLYEDHDFALFKLGSVGISAGAFAEYYSSVADLTWAGFRLGHTLRYSNSSGSQARLDAGTLNDSYRCFDTGDGWILHLPGLIGPGSPPNRLVWYEGVNANGYALFLSIDNSLVNNACEGLSFEDFQINGAGNGAIMAVGQLTNARFKNVTFNGGYYGLGGLCLGLSPITDSYPVHLHDCKFASQKDCAIKAMCWFGTIRGGEIIGYGRKAISAGGSALLISGTFFSGCSPMTATNVFRFPRLGIFGLHTIENINIDFEGDYPTQSHVYVEAEQDTPGSRLTIRDSAFGTAGVGRPIILAAAHANDAFNSYRPAALSVDGLRMESTGFVVHDPFVRADGTDLTSYAPNTAPGSNRWVAVTGTFTIEGNTVQPSSNNSGDLAVIDAGASDVLINVTSSSVYQSNSSCAWAGLVFRYADINNYWLVNYWLVNYSPNASVVILYEVQGGVMVNRASQTLPGIVSGTPTLLTVKAIGPDLSVWVNNVPRLSVTDSFNQTATKHGLHLSKLGTPATKPCWNAFQVYPANVLLDQGGGSAWQVLTANVLPLS